MIIIYSKNKNNYITYLNVKLSVEYNLRGTTNKLDLVG